MHRMLDENKVAKLNGYLDRLGWWNDKSLGDIPIHLEVGDLVVKAVIDARRVPIYSHGVGQLSLTLEDWHVTSIQFYLSKRKWWFGEVANPRNTTFDPNEIWMIQAGISIMGYFIEQLNAKKIFDPRTIKFVIPEPVKVVQKL